MFALGWPSSLLRSLLMKREVNVNKEVGNNNEMDGQEGQSCYG